MRNTNSSTHSRRQFLATSVTLALSMTAASSIWAADTKATKAKIGIIGSGRVGSALGGAWIKAGHQVMFSSRHLEDDQKLAASLSSNAHAGTPREAAAFADVLVVSVPFAALADVGKELGDLLKGKIVIDTCNVFEGRDGDIATAALKKGVAFATAELLPGARTVRAFNAIAANRMGMGNENPGSIGMPIAGQDEDATNTVAGLIREIGFEPVIIGDFKMANYLRPGTALAGEHSAEEIRKIVATLK
jgi:8-hydroxy-5-deazaflavin:NADPH oxidoreductase